MTKTEARVMRALAPGGHLTIDQIARHAEISVRRARTTAQALSRRGFAASGTGLHRDAWTLSPIGARFAASHHGRAVLDVPGR